MSCTRIGLDLDNLTNQLSQDGLPALWVLKREDSHKIESIPLLGSGKADLKGIKKEALKLSGEAS